MTDTAFMVRQDISYDPVRKPEELRNLLDDDAEMTNNHGTHGVTYYIGAADAEGGDAPLREPVLRVDVDPETGAGAVRWLPDGKVGVEDGYEPTPLRVSESSARADLVFIPAEVARVSYQAARAAAERYIATGQRPDNLSWA